MRDNKFMLQIILINLLKGVVYRDQDLPLWNNLLLQQGAVIEYFKMINLDVFVDEVEGYAFLRQRSSNHGNIPSIVMPNNYPTLEDNINSTTLNNMIEPENDDANDLPQLITRRQLNYTTSLLCVLLRKRMLEQDTSGSEIRLIVTREEVVALMSLYLPDKNNEVKLVEQIESCINKLVDLGFLYKLKNAANNSYEVRRIIKAFIDADWLSNLESKLKEYKDYANNAK